MKNRSNLKTSRQPWLNESIRCCKTQCTVEKQNASGKNPASKSTLWLWKMLYFFIIEWSMIQEHAISLNLSLPISTIPDFYLSLLISYSNLSLCLCCLGRWLRKVFTALCHKGGVYMTWYYSDPCIFGHKSPAPRYSHLYFSCCSIALSSRHNSHQIFTAIS